MNGKKADTNEYRNNEGKHRHQTSDEAVILSLVMLLSGDRENTELIMALLYILS